MNQMSGLNTPDSADRLFLDSTTNLDLLAAIQCSSETAWPTFVQKYTRLMRRWCEEWDANPEDTEDVVQETLLELFRRINDYSVNPDTTFRAWLRKVAYYRYLRILHKTRRSTMFTDSTLARINQAGGLLRTSQICDSFIKLIDTIADQEIVEIASRRIANRIPKASWEIFCRKEWDGTPSKMVAEQFGISVNAVDIITFRVRKMIRVEIEMLDPLA